MSVGLGCQLVKMRLGLILGSLIATRASCVHLLVGCLHACAGAWSLLHCLLNLAAILLASAAVTVAAPLHQTAVAALRSARTSPALSQALWGMGFNCILSGTGSVR